MVGIIAAILVSAAAIKGGDTGGTDEFIARQAWLYVAIVAGAYLISRGLAKSGIERSLHGDPTTTRRTEVVTSTRPRGRLPAGPSARASAGRAFRGPAGPIATDERQQNMTEPQTDERTTGGLAGKVAGKAKELAGELTNNDDLAREGRLQQAQGDAGPRPQRRATRPSRPTPRRSWRRTRSRRPRNAQRLEAEIEQRRAEEAAGSDREQTEIEAMQGGRRRDQAGRGHARSASTPEPTGAPRPPRFRSATSTGRRSSSNRRAREAESKADALDPKETR